MIEPASVMIESQCHECHDQVSRFHDRVSPHLAGVAGLACWLLVTYPLEIRWGPERSRAAPPWPVYAAALLLAALQLQREGAALWAALLAVAVTLLRQVWTRWLVLASPRTRTRSSEQQWSVPVPSAQGNRQQRTRTALGILPYSALIPVSYTHLRAHETPEHLVCRLLLEKKKKKTIQIKGKKIMPSK
eukprot:TRINITY_DN3693_c0_g9_i1.p1 TRINITY_DN3693_c0_g9~~TRINITY_DN3693_c0_g9_i1.p1  ORF type:complete len:189 (+),score=17.63 TRINITY_DN3693_c0_g9_i1:76-642(+)